jgi:hypothetical protein
VKAGSRFQKDVLAALDAGRSLRLRAGTEPHRFVGIWVVVVKGRVFVRSWTDKPKGWHRLFLTDPRGAIQIAGREIPVRARQARGERLRDAVDLAYRAKYPGPGSRKYVDGLARARRRATTTELMPW